MADQLTDELPEAIEEALREADEAVGRSEEVVGEAAEDLAKRLHSEDRSKIAKRIIWLFIAACLAAILFIAVAVLWTANGPAAEWKPAAELMVTILSSVILPVVTLVIGYYFGAETKQN